MHRPPIEVHLQVAYRILRYLKHTLGKEIMFKGDNWVLLEVCNNVDYVGSLVDKKSTSGYYTFLVGNLVTWRIKKQMLVSRSTAEPRVLVKGCMSSYN